MPKNIAIPDPVNTTNGINLTATRVAPGASGVRISIAVPGDPEGEFTDTLNLYSGASQTALVTIFNEAIAHLRAARGYV